MIRKLLVHPRVSPLLVGVFLALPTFITAAIYRIVRSCWVVDPRRESFDQIFSSLATSGIEGDYLEFGVYRGSSFIQAYQMAQKYGLAEMRFFAFDSFQGLPEAEGKTFDEGEFQCSRPLFTKIVQKAGVDLDKVMVVEGFYQDSLQNQVKVSNDLKRAALIHVDCDLYVSTKEVLRFVQDLLQPGCIIVMDDWHTFEAADAPDNPEQFGEPKAFEEWTESPRFDVIYDTGHGKAFVMREEVA